MQRLDQLDARRSLAPMLVAGAVLISLVGLLGHTSIEAASKGRQGPRALVHDGLLENRRDSSSSSGSSTVVYVADLKVEDSLVGWGDLGLNSELGYEGLKLVHNGIAHEHGVSIHASPHGTPKAFARFNLASRFPAAGFTKLLFSGAVAVNDKNNRLGKAGSELTFTLLCPDGDVLWKSKPLIETGTEDRAERIDVTGMATITLQVEASGNNHCAQSVWVDPIIEAS